MEGDFENQQVGEIYGKRSRVEKVLSKTMAVGQGAPEKSRPPAVDVVSG